MDQLKIAAQNKKTTNKYFLVNRAVTARLLWGFCLNSTESRRNGGQGKFWIICLY